MTTSLDHLSAAELLFASGQTPGTTRDAVRAIVRQYRAHPDIADAAATMAAEFGEHPDTAPARMAACLRIAPGRIDLPDALTPADAAVIGCEADECTAPGPYTPVGRRLYCVPCAARVMCELLLGETAGEEREIDG